MWLNKTHLHKNKICKYDCYTYYHFNPLKDNLIRNFLISEKWQAYNKYWSKITLENKYEWIKDYKSAELWNVTFNFNGVSFTKTSWSSITTLELNKNNCIWLDESKVWLTFFSFYNYLNEQNKDNIHSYFLNFYFEIEKKDKNYSLIEILEENNLDIHSLINSSTLRANTETNYKNDIDGFTIQSLKTLAKLKIWIFKISSDNNKKLEIIDSLTISDTLKPISNYFQTNMQDDFLYDPINFYKYPYYYLNSYIATIGITYNNITYFIWNIWNKNLSIVSYKEEDLININDWNNDVLEVEKIVPQREKDSYIITFTDLQSQQFLWQQFEKEILLSKNINKSWAYKLIQFNKWVTNYSSKNNSYVWNKSQKQSMMLHNYFDNKIINSSTILDLWDIENGKNNNPILIELQQALNDLLDIALTTVDFKEKSFDLLTTPFWNTLILKSIPKDVIIMHYDKNKFIYWKKWAWMQYYVWFNKNKFGIQNSYLKTLHLKSQNVTNQYLCDYWIINKEENYIDFRPFNAKSNLRYVYFNTKKDINNVSMFLTWTPPDSLIPYIKLFHIKWEHEYYNFINMRWKDWIFIRQ